MIKLSPKSYAQSWFSALYKADPQDWPKISQSFLQEIYRRGLTRWLAEITRFMRQYYSKMVNTTNLTVTSARTIPEEVINEAVESVLPGRKVQINRVLKDGLIGGIVIETMNQRWNLTVDGQLKNLAKVISQNTISLYPN